MQSNAFSRCLSASSIVLFSVILASPSLAQSNDASSRSFVANQGQWSGPAEFRSRAGGGTSWFVRDGWVLQLQHRVGVDEAALAEQSPNPLAASRSLDVEGVVLRMTLEGASSSWPVAGEAVLPGPRHFLIGDRSQWKVGVPAYERLRYRSVYPGVDIVVRPSGGLFEYDVHLAAGADVSQVVFRSDGMDRLDVDSDGSLVLHTAVGEVRQAPPTTWQTLPGGGKHLVTCSYRVIDGHRFGFAVPDRVRGLPLVIDPDLRWSTYLGGSSGDRLHGMERDASGVLTVAGYSDSRDFPVTSGAYQTTLAGSRDVVVSALDPSQVGAAQLLWSTYLGGADEDVAFGVDVDATGDVTVVGYTFSPSFPTTVGPAFGGQFDGFVTRLRPGGAGLVYSRLLGGALNDWACDVVVDSASVTTVVGCTGSSGFPTTANAYDQSQNGGIDVFVTRLAASGSVLYSSFIGGGGNDGRLWTSWQNYPENINEVSVALDAQGRLVVVGMTYSGNFPVTPGAFQVIHSGTTRCDAFALRLDPSATPASAQLQWSTFVGDARNDFPFSVDVQPSGLVTMGGCTYSSNFPTTPGAYSTTFVGTLGNPDHDDAVLVRLDPSQTGQNQLVYSTFLAGTEWECVDGVTVDSRGYATCTGFCGPGFPTTIGAYQTAFGGAQDAWVAKLTLAGQGAADLIYCSVLGGSAFDLSSAVVPDGNGGAFLAGSTGSFNFPVTGQPFQSVLAWAPDGFVAQLDLLPSNVARLPCASQHCGGSIVFEIDNMPVVGSPFAFLVGNAPPAAPGGMLFGSVTSPCLYVLGAQLGLLPVVALPIQSNTAGSLSVPFVTPPGLSGTLAVQTVWLNINCTVGPPLSSSTGLGL